MFRKPKRQRNDPVFWMSRRACEKKKHRGVETGPEELMVLLYVSESDKIELHFCPPIDLPSNKDWSL
jgi:hypothetical protein